MHNSQNRLQKKDGCHCNLHFSNVDSAYKKRVSCDCAQCNYRKPLGHAIQSFYLNSSNSNIKNKNLYSSGM